MTCNSAAVKNQTSSLCAVLFLLSLAFLGDHIDYHYDEWSLVSVSYIYIHKIKYI